MCADDSVALHSTNQQTPNKGLERTSAVYGKRASVRSPLNPVVIRTHGNGMELGSRSEILVLGRLRVRTGVSRRLQGALSPRRWGLE